MFLPQTGWALSLGDFLTTRTMELAVHMDDLAVSVGLPARELPMPPSTLCSCVLASHERLMIEVWDALSAPPDLRPHAIDADSGRGLEIVSLLSDRWGFYHPGGGGKVVWAVLEIGSGAAAGTQRVAQDHQPRVVGRDVGEPPPSPASAG